MRGYVQRLIDYNSWANRGLLQFLAALPPGTLDATAAGVYGTIRETLLHQLSSELNYYHRLASAPPVETPPRPESPGLAFIQRLADESAANLAGLVDRLPGPGRMMETSDGMRAAATIVTQLFMHGCEHRAHIGTMLGANGIEPPDLDSWAYGIFAGGDDWPPEWGPDRRSGPNSAGLTPGPPR